MDPPGGPDLLELDVGEQHWERAFCWQQLLDDVLGGGNEIAQR